MFGLSISTVSIQPIRPPNPITFLRPVNYPQDILDLTEFIL